MFNLHRTTLRLPNTWSKQVCYSTGNNRLHPKATRCRSVTLKAISPLTCFKVTPSKTNVFHVEFCYSQWTYWNLSLCSRLRFNESDNCLNVANVSFRIYCVLKLSVSFIALMTIIVWGDKIVEELGLVFIRWESSNGGRLDLVPPPSTRLDNILPIRSPTINFRHTYTGYIAVTASVV